MPRIDNGTVTAEQDPTRHADGKFRKGVPAPGRGGRPVAVRSFMALCRAKAAEQGLDFEDLVWGAVKGMCREAMNGNVRAATVLFDRVWGPTGTPQINVDVNATAGAAASSKERAPVMPTGRELSDYMQKLVKVAADQQLIEAGRITVEPHVPTDLDDVL